MGSLFRPSKSTPPSTATSASNAPQPPISANTDPENSTHGRPDAMRSYHEILEHAQMTIALLHPGEMGAATGHCLVTRGVRVVWASENRSPETRKRAEQAGLEDLESLDRALAASDAVLSICAPSGALELARQVAARGYKGIYIDANAISPAHSREIGCVI